MQIQSLLCVICIIFYGYSLFYFTYQNEIKYGRYPEKIISGLFCNTTNYLIQGIQSDPIVREEGPVTLKEFGKFAKNRN